MNYPNSKKTYVKPKENASKRGMSLEEDINKSNSTYLNKDISVIYKKPTPVQIVKVDYPKRSAAKIIEAYFKVPSTTDYNGIYKGKYIDFEAKECESKSSFPFSSIHSHQIKHLDNVLKHGAISFIIIRMKAYEKDYLIKTEDFIKYYKTSKRKSLPITWIQNNGYEIKGKYGLPCDYIKVLDEIYKLWQLKIKQRKEK